MPYVTFKGKEYEGAKRIYLMLWHIFLSQDLLYLRFYAQCLIILATGSTRQNIEFPHIHLLKYLQSIGITLYYAQFGYRS